MAVMAGAGRMGMGLIAIVGPTATGKTALAIAVAEALGTGIIGADSRQIYRYFDVGTAKPTGADRDRVAHALVDCWEPDCPKTLADYQELARSRLEAMQRSGRVPLLVGGTGLYVKSIVRGLKIPRVAPQPQLRSQLMAQGQVYCYGCLRRVDPAAAAKIHPNDVTRTVRALEIFYCSGRPASEQQGEAPPPYPILQIGIDCLDAMGEGRSRDRRTKAMDETIDRGDRLTVRIGQRTRAMFEAGFVAEAAALRDRYGPDLPLLQTLGYREVGQFLDGQISLTEAEALTVLHTRQFAKRQRTWFRADPTIQWLDSDDPQVRDRAIALARAFQQRLK